MAFTLPVFDLTCNVYSGPWLGKLLRAAGVPCNLAWGRRVSPFLVLNEGQSPEFQGTMTLLLPALTDVRDGSGNGPVDILEVPAGSGRWYAAWSVDDIGKGFANEHRAVIIGKVYQQLNPIDFAGCAWPLPIP